MMDNKMNKRISVVIPTYKRQIEYLSRSICSIKNQSYKNIEIIIVDDNSPDSYDRKQVMQFMQKFKEDADIKYVMNPTNLGGSLARNEGIDAASGEYITFLDDDDEYLPGKVEKQVNFMIENDCDLSFTDLKLVNDKKKVVDYREYRNLKSYDKEDLLKYHLMRHLTGTPTFMYKTNKLKSIGGFEDAKMGQEFYLMLKSIEQDLKIRYFPECDVIAYRHSNGGISQGQNKIDGENAIYNFKKTYFHIFNRKEKMFIRFRHYAVMVVAYKRNGNYFKLVGSVVKMFFASPVDLSKEVSNHMFKLLKTDKRGTLI